MSEITDFLDLMKTNPQAAEQALIDDPVLRKRIGEQIDVWDAGEVVTVDSFIKWYEVEYLRPMPKILGGVVEEFCWAYHNRKGVILEAWRGFGKSTFFMAWGPFLVGENPVGSTALIRINDQKAQEMGKTISDIISMNTGWKKMFGHIIPDMRAGWSMENGFEVIDTRVTGLPGSPDFETNYAKWRMLCLANHLSEKSLVCNGIESGSNIGIHPTNGEWFEDVHDESNTRSQAEMKKTTDLVKANFIPTWFSTGGAPTLGVFCTPWSDNPPDAYEVMYQTGLFKKVSIPIFREDAEGVEIPKTTTGGETLSSEWAGKKVTPTWPEAFPVERIADIIYAAKTRFGQMYLLDVSLSRPKKMRYQSFPHNEIKWNEWPLIAGVDPVSTIKGISKGDGISHFAMGYGLKTPYNNLVIGDGVVEKCDADEGEKLVVEAERTYKKTFRRVSIEGDGSGVMFIGMLTRNPSLKNKWSRHNTSDIGKGDKMKRQYDILQPVFANGSVLVSDADTPYLNSVREYLDLFPFIDKESALWDVGDSLVMIVVEVPELWTKIVVNSDDGTIWTAQKKQKDPYTALMEGRR